MTTKLGVHGRNDEVWHEADFQLLELAKIQTIKMMSHTSPAIFQKLRDRFPKIELITRLYHPQLQGEFFNGGKFPPPAMFVEKVGNQLDQITRACDCTKFEIHNEPNHKDRYEGWGWEDEHAKSFNSWFLAVYRLIKEQFPSLQLGFPGLAIPHRDWEWIEICRPAIEEADWLGVHCYWQTPNEQPDTYLQDFWGLRFKYYHEVYPGKPIEITEAGNSGIQNGILTPEEEIARQYVDYVTLLRRDYEYVNSVSFFIMSSPDPTWNFFAWRDESGRMKPVVKEMGKLEETNEL